MASKTNKKPEKTADDVKADRSQPAEPPKTAESPATKAKRVREEGSKKSKRGGTRQGSGRFARGSVVTVAGGGKVPRDMLAEVTGEAFGEVASWMAELFGPHWKMKPARREAIGHAFVTMAEAYGWFLKGLPPWGLMLFALGPYVGGGMRGQLRQGKRIRKKKREKAEAEKAARSAEGD